MRGNTYFPIESMRFRCPVFTTAKKLPGSYTIAKSRNFPEEQKKNELAPFTWKLTDFFNSVLTS